MFNIELSNIIASNLYVTISITDFDYKVKKVIEISYKQRGGNLFDNRLGENMEEIELQEFTINLGKRLKMLREKNGVTQEKMSDEANCSKNYISAIERGVHKLTVPMLIEYCRVLRLSPNEVLGVKTGKNKFDVLINSLSQDEVNKVCDFIEIMRR